MSSSERVAGGAASVLLAVALVLAVFATIAGIWFFVKLPDINDIGDLKDWQDDIDDAIKIKDHGATTNIKNNVEIDGTLEVQGSSVVLENVVLKKDFPVCSDGAVVEGNVVSLYEGCITNGFEPFPAFVYDTQAAGIIDEKRIVSLGDGNAISLYSDSADSGFLKAKSLRYVDSDFSLPVLQSTIGGPTVAASTWAGTGVGDGSTAFVVRSDDDDSGDVHLFRCHATDSTIGCDAGQLVDVSVSGAILELLHLGASGTTQFFAALYLDVGNSTVNTIAFHTTTTSNAAVVVEAAPVVIDTDADYATMFAATNVPPARLVNLSGANSAFTFAVVYGGVNGVDDVSIVVHTLGASPSTTLAPTQTDISGSPYVVYTRSTGGDNAFQFDASALPGTNNIAVVVTDPTDGEPLNVYSASANPNALLTAVTFDAPSGQGTIIQPRLTAAALTANNAQIACLNPTVCVVAYRAIYSMIPFGKVAAIEFGSDGAIENINDRSQYSAGNIGSVSMVAAGTHHFYVAFYESNPLNAQERAKIVRGAFSTSNSERGEIYFGAAAGKYPLGIATEGCVGSSNCAIQLFGGYELPSGSPVGTLNHASSIYAYCDGTIGISEADSSDPLCPSVQLGVHIGDNVIFVRPSGVFTQIA
jgi:hypothetical protein